MIRTAGRQSIIWMEVQLGQDICCFNLGSRVNFEAQGQIGSGLGSGLSYPSWAQVLFFLFFFFFW